MTDLFQQPDDATPLDPSLRGDLLQSWITSRADLNEAEEENIVKGAAWGHRRRGKAADLLTEHFVKTLHKQMFGEVWKWAGAYRQGELNIGIAPHLIVVQMPGMLDDVRYWAEYSPHPPDEIAARLHHRLTQIGAFLNGNGRHARMMADLLIERLGGQLFSWGRGSLADAGTLRGQYVAALKVADNHNIEPLLTFMRS
jgi:Fic-DOC domain mobile mystery protein B